MILINTFSGYLLWPRNIICLNCCSNPAKCVSHLLKKEKSEILRLINFPKQTLSWWRNWNGVLDFNFKYIEYCIGPVLAKSITTAKHLFFMSSMPPQRKGDRTVSYYMEFCLCHFFFSVTLMTLMRRLTLVRSSKFLPNWYGVNSSKHDW